VQSYILLSVQVITNQGSSYHCGPSRKTRIGCKTYKPRIKTHTGIYCTAT